MPRSEREGLILGAATDEFGRNGYAGASMVDIAKLVGVTKPLLYQYFGSKDGLYLACLHRAGDRLTQGVAETMAAGGEPEQMPLAVLGAIFRTFDHDRYAWKLLRDNSLPTVGEIGDAVRDYRAQLDAFALIGATQLMHARGLTENQDIEAIAHVWTGVVDSLISWWIDQPGEDATAMTDRCARIMKNLFGW
ncbi:DNA-binding transcriptional regulator, AcrR family [Amycolatopsis xylanica]|uniref:DNA-binding transcriptional regulator, AcrR family n=1 Tax=Amycolatopsis xylanica TaxID=589385 RepID=A0A1H3JCP5_9PSEU|nr:TetR/AcrR family transcriptional regulator [Amycolatopsis xylanica]SDY37339.1 DNA-binding transcriptional regulator, AcrR family [Amycolatopsis xylanica]